MKGLDDQNVQHIPCISKNSRMCGPPHLQAKDCSRSLFREEAVDSRSLDAHPTVKNSKWSQKNNQHDPNGTKGEPKGCQPTQKMLQKYALERLKF